ncbi:flagellar basal-body MS-ring/collar protein FliF [Tessaracoccus sp.]
MTESLSRTMARAQSAWSSINLFQRIMLGVVLISLIGGGVVFTKWVSQPTYAPLFSNLASTDASAIVDELNASGGKYTLAEGGGTIMVPKDQVYTLRLQMSGKGLPAGTSTGYALLDKQGITTSEFQQNIQYQRALEGELANTLQAMDGVRTAVVHVALPKQDVFADATRKPTASVLLSLAPGKTLNAGQVQAVTHLVASSVEGMDPTEVTLADSTGRVLSAAGVDSTSGLGDAQTQMRQDMQDQLAANAQQILDRVVGTGKGVVRVNADLNFDRKDATSEKYTYNKLNAPISDTTTTEKYTGAGTPTGGVLGPTNVTGVGAAGTAGASKYDKTSGTRNNAVDKTVETVKAATGSIKRLTVSVLLDTKTAGSLDQVKLQELVSNAVGLDLKRGDAISVAEMPFDTTVAAATNAEVIAANKAAAKASQMALIKNGAIGGLFLVFLLVVWLRSRKRTTKPEGLTVEHSKELAALKRELASRELLNRAEDDAIGAEDVRRHQVRAEISEMIDKNPDEVTSMLRGWLVEEKS